MEEEVYLGFGDYLTILQRRKKQFMIPAVVVLFIGAALAIGLPSVYKSQATILIEQQEIPTDLVRSTVTSYAGERIQVISQRIMTTENLSKIIDDYGLYKNERDDASTTFLAKKLHDEIQLEMVSADVVDPRSGRPTTATIAFKLSFSDRNPRVAQKVTNQLVSLYLDENLKQRAQSALETSSFLNAESEKYKHQISDLEAKLAVFKEANFSSLPELQQLNIQLMERNDRDLADVDKQIRNLEEKKIYMQSELAQLSPTNDLYNSRGNRVLGTEDRLRELRTQYVSLSARYTDNHPTLVKLLEEMEALKEELNSNDYESGSFDLKSENPAYVQLKTQLQAVDTELATLKD
ncbi:MAG: lipopolysaccharide biosynthesis protein, partial [Candidatus Thiodiazotropha sp.]